MELKVNHVQKENIALKGLLLKRIVLAVIMSLEKDQVHARNAPLVISALLELLNQYSAHWRNIAKPECKREVNVQQELLEKVQDSKPRLNVHPALQENIAKMDKLKMTA